MWLNQIQITEIILTWRCEKSVVGLDKFVSAMLHVNKTHVDASFPPNYCECRYTLFVQ